MGPKNVIMTQSWRVTSASYGKKAYLWLNNKSCHKGINRDKREGYMKNKEREKRPSDLNSKINRGNAIYQWHKTIFLNQVLGFSPNDT